MKKIFSKLAVLMALFTANAMAAAAAATSIPGVDNFVQIMIDLAGGKVGLLLIVIIMGFSAYNAWKNANVTALLWGLFASIVLAVLVPYATKMLEWANSGAVLG